MNKNTQKIRQFIAFLMALVIAMTSGFPVAKAGVLDWLSGQNSDTSTSRAFGFVTSYLNPNSQLPDSGQENMENLPIVQNNSLVSANPITAPKQPTIAAKPTIIYQIKEMMVSATAYSSTPDQTDSTPFITALGTTVRDGIIAANFLPFGTKIKIPEIYGDKIFVVEDRMNRRYWHTIDVWFPDRQSALEFGFKKVKIQILES